MKELNRFEYLQLAAVLLPKEEIIKRHPDLPLERLYEILSEELFSQAKVIRLEYESRYRHERSEQFELEPADSLLPQ